MSELTNKDYRRILEFYNKNIPKSNRLLKEEAEKIISSKLCRCIKKVSHVDKDEKQAIGICSKTVINNKGFARGKFTCKKKQSIKLFITKKNATRKK